MCNLQKIVINKEVINICYPFPAELGKTYARLIVTFRFLCYYAIPLFIIGIFYALIAKHLIHAASHVPGENFQGVQRQVISALLYLFIVFVQFMVFLSLACFVDEYLWWCCCVCPGVVFEKLFGKIEVIIEDTREYLRMLEGKFLDEIIFMSYDKNK